MKVLLQTVLLPVLFQKSRPAFKKNVSTDIIKILCLHEIKSTGSNTAARLELMQWRHQPHRRSSFSSLNLHNQTNLPIIRPLHYYARNHPNHFYPSLNVWHLIHSKILFTAKAHGKTSLSDVQQRNGTTCLKTVLMSGMRVHEMTLMPRGARARNPRPNYTHQKHGVKFSRSKLVCF